MSKCIDCLHYEACKDTHDILDPACSGEFDYEMDMIFNFKRKRGRKNG